MTKRVFPNPLGPPQTGTTISFEYLVLRTEGVRSWITNRDKSFELATSNTLLEHREPPTFLLTLRLVLAFVVEESNILNPSRTCLQFAPTARLRVQSIGVWFAVCPVTFPVCL